MTEQLMTIDDVAVALKVSAKTVKRLKIDFSRIGRQRRYHPRDVEEFRQRALECQSSSDRGRRSTIANSSSRAVGFAEALVRSRSERQRASSANSERRSSGKQKATPCSQSPSAPDKSRPTTQSTRHSADTGLNTE